MWIKQHNDACQTLLECWAEPFSCWAEYVDRRPPSVMYTGVQPIDRLHNPTDVLRLAWRRLLENHPHDSICGCSVDQVHKEMAVRFDEVEQIGAEITRQSLEALARAVDTSKGRAVIAFNPTAGPRADVVEAPVELLGGAETAQFILIDAEGRIAPCEVLGREDRVFGDMEGPGTEMQAVLVGAAEGWLMDMAVEGVHSQRQGTMAEIQILLSEQGVPDLGLVARGFAGVQKLLADPEVTSYRLVLRMVPRLRVRFVAYDVPGHGYKAWRVAGGSPDSMSPYAGSGTQTLRIENEFFAVEASPADGTLTITDRHTGAVYTGLNHFVDGGDRGDQYNFCRPEEDVLISAPVRRPEIRTDVGPIRQTLDIGLHYRLPSSLAPDRRSRASEWVDTSIHTRIGLSSGVRRVDVHTVVDNQARDHRLRVHFPAPVETQSAQYDGHFQIVSRPLGLPAEDTSTWIEQPAAEQPQRRFVDVSDGRTGLLVANRGLPEVEVVPGDGPTTVALTLLRCVGWLSRDDLHCRHGHAGPPLPTPGAQCLGVHEFDYALVPHAGDWQAAFSEGYAFASPLRTVSTGPHKGELPVQTGIVTAEPASFVITAIKHAEAGRGWIVRGYSVADKVVSVRLRPWRRFSRAARLRLDEKWLEDLTVGSDGQVEFAVRPREIVTVGFFEGL
jgi:alpha-mannosidase